MMSSDVRALKPEAVWNMFADLNAVPRPSKKEERIIRFMVDFGNGLQLETFTDHVGNVIIRKPATNGMEGKKTVTLQSHLDMVHQKNNDTDFDFDSQGIEMFVDGDWVKAKGTTLGADNGMGVAAIMALLASTDIAHPTLEALFTIDEETGMTGAKGLKGEVLQGDILLNLDTEEDDEIDIGCAGGVDVTSTGTYVEDSAIDGESVEVTVKGLQGGHSGMQIHEGLGNANKIMNRLLYNASDRHGIRIAEIQGGGLRNAIPRESTAKIVVPNASLSEFKNDFKEWSATVAQELASTEPELKITMASVAAINKVMHFEAQQQLLRVIYAAHNGVYAMSAAIPDLVETSNNLAKVQVAQGKIKIACLTRSSVQSAKMDLANALKSTFELGGFDVSFHGAYPGWQPNPHSEIVKVLERTYEALFGHKASVVACHAGLECGILGKNYPEMDMISFGPTIKGAHSPDERVQISSVQKFWKFLLEILKDIPEKGDA